MKYKSFLFGNQVPDIIIEDDVTWIKVDDQPGLWSGLWPGIAYERLEVVRAKDYDPARSSVRDPYERPGARSGRYSAGNYGSYHRIVDESGIYEPKHSTPLINESLWQASLYHNIVGKDDGIRGWPA